MNRHGAVGRPSARGRQAAAALAAAVALGGCGSAAGAAGGSAKAHATRDSANGVASPTVGATRNEAVTNVAELLQIGIGQAEQKDWSAAETTFGDVLAIVPKDVYALYNLGLIDQSIGNTSGADSYYDQAIADDATYTPALYNLAITLETSDPGQALSLYQKIVSINPRASTAYLRMAFVYAKQGDVQQAKAAQAKAIAIDPSLGKYPLPPKN